MAVIAWIVALAGSIAAAIKLNSYYPKFSWWAITFQLLLLLYLPVLYMTNTIHYHQNFLTCCLAIAFVYNSNSTNNLIYYSWSSTAAAAAGFIVTCIINLLWLFYFGSDPDSPLVTFLDSFGENENLVVQSRRLNDEENGISSHGEDKELPNQTATTNGSEVGKESDNPFEGEMYSQELSGLENPARDEESHRASRVAPAAAAAVANPAVSKHENYAVATDADYPILVRGLYDYTASPDDMNELSFHKGEVLKVKDTTGNWWQGKNSKGSIGMCPSNYLQVIG